MHPRIFPQAVIRGIFQTAIFPAINQSFGQAWRHAFIMTALVAIITVQETFQSIRHYRQTYNKDPCPPAPPKELARPMRLLQIEKVNNESFFLCVCVCVFFVNEHQSGIILIVTRLISFGQIFCDDGKTTWEFPKLKEVPFYLENV